jgi:hypothetical protein
VPGVPGVPGVLGVLAVRLLAAFVIVGLNVATASAQINGHVSVMFDMLPDLEDAVGRQSASELRARIFAERHDEFGSHLRINISGYVDGLIADRGVFRLKLRVTRLSAPRTSTSTSSPVTSTFAPERPGWSGGVWTSSNRPMW